MSKIWAPHPTACGPGLTSWQLFDRMTGKLQLQSGSLVIGFGQAYTLSGDRFGLITPRGRG